MAGQQDDERHPPSLADAAMNDKTSDVHWGFRYYLARGAESAATVEAHARSDDLRRALYSSKEACETYSKKVPRSEFCVWRRDRPKIGVLSNCQGPEIARAIAAIADVSVYGLEVMLTKDASASSFLEMLDGCDFILSARMSDEWGLFGTNAMKARYGDRLVTYTPVYYLGLHPDITYIGKTLLRIPSPVGDYHSRIVLSHFLGDHPVQAALDQFSAEGFEKLNYRQIAVDSEREYHDRERLTDLKTAAWFFENFRTEPLLYSLNHPTPVLTQQIARTFIEHIGLEARKADANLTPSGLSSNIIWPVHGFWADALKLSYQSSDLFHTSMYAMDIEEFAWRSYEIYRRVDRTALVGDAAARGVHPV